MVDPPPLPPRFNRVTTVLAVGTALWLVAALLLLGNGRPFDVVVLTCVVGAGLGGVGYAVFAWQRAAARRGSRTAQQGLE